MIDGSSRYRWVSDAVIGYLGGVADISQLCGTLGQDDLDCGRHTSSGVCTCRLVHRRARQIAPFEDGTLRDSIKIVGTGGRGLRVTVKAAHGFRHHFGYRKGGKPTYHLYLYRAAEEVKAKAEKVYEDHVRGVIRKRF